jgi:hypothetical protein
VKDWLTSIRLPATKQYASRTAWVGWPDDDGRYPIRIADRKCGYDATYTDYLCSKDDDGTILFAKLVDERETLQGFEATEDIGDDLYAVTRLGKGQVPECTCPGRTAGGRMCKHILIAQKMLQECVFDRKRVSLKSQPSQIPQHAQG